ncbi:MAG: phage tail protein [Magnetospirillum sp. WYHS-4]
MLAATKPLPLAPTDIDLVVPPGGTVLDIIRLAAPALLDVPGLTVWIARPDDPASARAVPFRYWGQVKPRPGMVVVAGVVAGKGGGGGGGKSVGRLVASIAVMVAAFYVGGLVGGLEIGPSILGKNLLGMAAGFATSMVGNAIVNALVPAPTPRISEAAAGMPALAKDDPVYSITGTTNRARPYEPVREVFGRRRIFPDVAGEAYVERVNGKTYVRMLLIAGKGPLKLSAWQVGDTPAEDLKDIEIEVREGWATDEPLTLYADDHHLESLTVKLSGGAGWHQRRTAPNADEAFVNWVFQRGLTKFTGTNSRDAVTVEFEVEVSPAGAGTWQKLAWANAADAGFGTAGYATVSDSVSGGEVRRDGRIKFPARGQYDIRVRRNTADASSNDVVDESHWAGLRSITYRDPINIPGVAKAAIRIQAGAEFNGTVDTLNCLAERWCEVHDEDTGTWSWGLSRNPADGFIDFLRRRKVKPIPAARMALANLMAWRADCAEMDGDGAPRYTFDAVYEQAVTVRQVLDDICAAGRARRGLPDGKWGVIRDIPQAGPMGTLTPTNTWGWRESETYVNVPHALRVKFEDEEAGYRVTEVLVYNDGYDEATATDFEVIEFLGCTRYKQAYRLGRYRFAEAKLRPATYTVSQAIENLDFDRGDLVLLSHPVMRVGLGDGRIKALVKETVEGVQRVTGVVLDSTVTMEAGKDYGLRIRRAKEGQRVTDTLLVATEADVVDRLAFRVPVPISIEPERRDLWMFGEAGLEGMPVIITSIDRGPDLSAVIQCQDAAQDIHAAVDGPIPARQLYMTKPPVAQRRPAPPAIASIVSDETVAVRLAGGGFLLGLRVGLAPREGTGPAVAELKARWRRIDQQDWSVRTGIPGDASEILIQGVDQGALYTIEVQAIAASGIASTWAKVPEHQVVGKSSPPPDPDGLYVEVLPDGRTRYRVTGPAAVDSAGWLFRWRPGVDLRWAGATPAHAGVQGADTFEASAFAAGTYTVLVKAVDVDGNESLKAASAIVRLGERVAANWIDGRDFGAEGWPGTITGGAVADGEIRAVASGILYADPNQPLYIDPADTLYGAWDALAYEATLIPVRKGYLAIAADAPGASVEYAQSGGGPLYTNPHQPLYTDPSQPLYTGGAFIPYAGPFLVAPGVPLAIRVSLPGGPVQGIVRGLDASIEVETTEEVLPDVALPAVGARLAPTRAWMEILTVEFAVQQAPGCTAIRCDLLDKDPAGPLCRGYDAANLPASALIDATIKGIPLLT